MPIDATPLVVDPLRYPLHDPDSPPWRAAVTRARRGLAEDGCAVLRGFVAAEHLDALDREGAGLAPFAHERIETVNVYNTDPDPTLPPEHPAHWTTQRGNAFVARDRIPADALIQRIYTDARVQRFVAACVGLERVHELADPLAGLCLNTVRPGRDHPWHFDTNEFAVSMLTRAPEGGGVFEYCPAIRSADDENLDAVSAVLRGDGDRLVRRIVLQPGDLQVFTGRYSLHRVTPVTGTRDRHSAIFAYSAHAGVLGSPVRTRQLFGRVHPDHLDTGVRVDSLLA